MSRPVICDLCLVRIPAGNPLSVVVVKAYDSVKGINDVSETHTLDYHPACWKAALFRMKGTRHSDHHQEVNEG